MDDGSKDNYYKEIKQWQEKKHVKVFTKKNEGNAKALNQLLPHVTADFVLELDAVDWLDPDAVSVIKTKLQHLHNTVAVDRKSTRLNSSHVAISYAVFCLTNKSHAI